MQKILTGFFDVHFSQDEQGNRRNDLKLVLVVSEDGFCHTEKYTVAEKDAHYMREKLDWALSEVNRLNEIQGKQNT